MHAMTTPLRRVPSRMRWSTKQYILAAVLGMVATVAVAAAISISLAPAHIAFYVRDANITYLQLQIQLGTETEDDGNKQPLNFWYYNLTLVANNTSRRTAVSYGSLAVDIWSSETSWIPTEEVNASAVLPGWLPPGSTSLVMVGAEGGKYYEQTTTPPAASEAKPPPPPQGPSSNEAVDNATVKWPDCRVVVEAKVWFRFAGVHTLPYTVRVSCFPVNFLDGTSGPVNCTG